MPWVGHFDQERADGLRDMITPGLMPPTPIVLIQTKQVPGPLYLQTARPGLRGKKSHAQRRPRQLPAPGRPEASLIVGILSEHEQSIDLGFLILRAFTGPTKPCR